MNYTYISEDKINSLKTLMNLISDYERNIFHVKKAQADGIMNMLDATSEIQMYKSKEMRAKEQFVKAVHVNKDGTPKKIDRENNDRKWWYTKLPGHSYRTVAGTYEALINKIYDFYSGSANDLSFGNMFSKALDEKERTMNNSPRTIERIRQDYKYFITKDFASKSIREITVPVLQEYVQRRTKELNPGQKRLKQFKGLLNLTFKYALYYEKIDKNPVNALELRRYYPDCKVQDRSSKANVFSPEEIEIIKAEVRRRIEHGHGNVIDGYYINGYITLIAINTGMRVAELCALKWTDIDLTEGIIHIHAQQLVRKNENGEKEFYYEDSTKEEKRVSNGGREFPILPEIEAILTELKALQKSLGIESEFVFCNKDGSWVKTNKYTAYLQRMLRSLALECPATRNHAFRKTFNTNVLIPAGIDAPDRAALLGHTVETNERHYTFASRHYLQNARDKINALNQENRKENDVEPAKIAEVNPGSTQKIIPFEKIKKAETLVK